MQAPLISSHQSLLSNLLPSDCCVELKQLKLWATECHESIQKSLKQPDLQCGTAPGDTHTHTYNKDREKW